MWFNRQPHWQKRLIQEGAGALFLAFLIYCWYEPERVTLEQEPARVTSITDGDSLHVQLHGQDLVIRLEGIDAPEMKQPGGPESKAALSAFAFGKDVKVATTGKDRYGRTLAILTVAGSNINESMVANGHAWHFIRPPLSPFPAPPMTPLAKSKFLSDAHLAGRLLP